MLKINRIIRVCFMKKPGFAFGTNTASNPAPGNKPIKLKSINRGEKIGEPTRFEPGYSGNQSPAEETHRFNQEVDGSSVQELPGENTDRHRSSESEDKANLKGDTNQRETNKSPSTNANMQAQGVDADPMSRITPEPDSTSHYRNPRAKSQLDSLKYVGADDTEDSKSQLKNKLQS